MKKKNFDPTYLRKKKKNLNYPLTLNGMLFGFSRANSRCSPCLLNALVSVCAQSGILIGEFRFDSVT